MREIFWEEMAYVNPSFTAKNSLSNTKPIRCIPRIGKSRFGTWQTSRPGNVFFNANGSMLIEQPQVDMTRRAISSFLSREFSDQKVFHKGIFYTSGGFGCTENIGHCITDCIAPAKFMGKIMQAHERFPSTKHALILPSPRNERIKSRMLELLDLFSVKDYYSEIKFIDEHQCIIGSAIYPQDLTIHPYFHHPNTLLTLNEAPEEPYTQECGAGSMTRLAVVPRQSNTRELSEQSYNRLFRKLKNIDEDFSVINCIEESAKNIAEKMRNSDVIIGVAGANLSNTIFCKKGTKIIALEPEDMPCTYFKSIARALEHDYISIKLQGFTYLSQDRYKLRKNQIKQILLAAKMAYPS